MTETRLEQRRRHNATYRRKHPEKIRAYLADWYQRNQEHVRAYRAAHRDEMQAKARVKGLERHGITVAQYDELLAAQGGTCAICHESQTTFSDGRVRRLDVDHDHRCCPGRHSCGACIRGLLCSNCNRGIFRFHPPTLAAAAFYFEGFRP